MGLQCWTFGTWLYSAKKPFVLLHKPFGVQSFKDDAHKLTLILSETFYIASTDLR